MSYFLKDGFFPLWFAFTNYNSEVQFGRVRFRLTVTITDGNVYNFSLKKKKKEKHSKK